VIRTTPGRASSIARACAAARAAALAARESFGGLGGFVAGAVASTGAAFRPALDPPAADRPVAGRSVPGFAEAGFVGAACVVVARSDAALPAAFFGEPFVAATAAGRPDVTRAGAMREGAPRCGTRDVGFVLAVRFAADFDAEARAGKDLRAGAGRDALPPECFDPALFNAELFLNVEGFFTFDLATEPLAPFGPDR